MSTICAVVNLNGEPVSPERLQKMIDASSFRLHDDVSTLCRDNFGLAFLGLRTTPESLNDKQPLVDSRGDLYLIADARIDNREDLIRILRPKDFLRDKHPTDAQLILAAYEFWGDKCARELVGDFAFFVWDAKRRRAFAARDVIGIRQLHYARYGQTLVVATTVGGVRDALPSPATLNRAWLEEFARARFGLSTCETVYNEIRRLPPAHFLNSDERTSSTHLYYVPGSSGPADIRSTAEWCEAFKALLDESLRQCLRSSTGVGILTSGGLDSSALACLAHAQALSRPETPQIKLFTNIFRETKGADEEEYFDLVAHRCSSFPAGKLICDSYWSFSCDTDRSAARRDEPCVIPTPEVLRAMCRNIRSEGNRVAILGLGANEVLGHPAHFAPEVLWNVDLKNWLTQAHHYRRVNRLSWGGLLYQAYIRPLWSRLPETVKRQLRPLKPERRRWLTPLASPGRRIVCRVDNDFFAPRGLSEAVLAGYRLFRSGYSQAVTLELDRVAASLGMELRYPYYNRNLVDFLMYIPHDLLTSGGIDRVLLRRSFVGILPEEIRVRLDKAHTGDLLSRGYRIERSKLKKAAVGSCVGRLGLVNEHEWGTVLEDPEAEPAASVRNAILCTLNLEFWLRGLQSIE